jgi:sugar phosphate isomerase/epimerase
MMLLLQKVLRLLAIPLLLLPVPLLVGAADPPTQPSLLVYDFNHHLGPSGNVDYVKSLGFSGLVTSVKTPPDLIKLRRYVRYSATVEGFQLLAFVNYDFSDTASSKVWRDALPLLAKAGAPLWVILNNAPSPLAVRQLLTRMAVESEPFGVRTVIYPHWVTDIETAAEASVLIADIAHPNLGSSLHTCHEIRSGNQYSLASVVAAHAAQAELVAIAGADENAYFGPPVPGITWADAIKPLAEGDFSLLPFLQALHDSGYDGPVVLQTFGIVDDPGHLQESLLEYAAYTSQIAP